ncbi:MAG: cyclopropane fatty-acyl-phospholipid synthase-like methyltransferase [Lentisphaeria bacterium]|jgi:cyclopropane fatty-acyl-phospholipid synthase-like methyltransferase
MLQKPFSQACENNKTPILNELKRIFQRTNSVLEIGSGTGQHAVFFAQNLPWLTWQSTDRPENIAGINLWLEEAQLANLLPGKVLDVSESHWPENFDAVFSSNTAHIMSWSIAQTMISGVARRLPEGGVFALYGPFNYGGAYTSDSNREFDAWLRAHNPVQGLRDFEQVNACAQTHGLHLCEDNAMPANNRLLVWSKTEAIK